MNGVTTEDRQILRAMARDTLTGQLFAELTEKMVRSLAKRRPKEQQEAWIMAFFDVLQGELMDVRNKVLAELRKGA